MDKLHKFLILQFLKVGLIFHLAYVATLGKDSGLGLEIVASMVTILRRGFLKNILRLFSRHKFSCFVQRWEAHFSLGVRPRNM